MCRHALTRETRWCQMVVLTLLFKNVIYTHTNISAKKTVILKFEELWSLKF